MWTRPRSVGVRILHIRWRRRSVSLGGVATMSIFELAPAEADAASGAVRPEELLPIIAGLQARYPEVEPAIVRRCVEHAAHGFQGARIRNFLPTLIERTAAEDIRASAWLRSPE
jgi:hypothetical protein